MNDRDLKRLLSTLQIPDADNGEREAALASALQALRPAENSLRPVPGWTWREWLWPSPFAWGALAIVWLALGLDRASEPAAETARMANVPPTRGVPSSLFLAHSDMQELLRRFQQSAPKR